MAELLPPQGMPNSGVVCIETFLKELLPEITDWVRRPMRPTDPQDCVAIFAEVWNPGQAEIGNYGPSLSRYNYRLQYLHHNTSEEEGTLRSGQMAKRLRTMLYQRPDLRVRLAALTETVDGVLERVTTMGITSQRFLSAELRGTFTYLNAIDFWIEVESFPTS